MKWYKSILTICAFLVGLCQAYAETSRVEFIYVNKCSPYVKLAGAFNPALCVVSPPSPCFYRVNVDLGATTTESILIASGGTPGQANRCYLGN
jgi:hypothetical protein